MTAVVIELPPPPTVTTPCRTITHNCTDPPHGRACSPKHIGRSHRRSSRKGSPTKDMWVCPVISFVLCWMTLCAPEILLPFHVVQILRRVCRSVKPAQQVEWTGTLPLNRKYSTERGCQLDSACTAHCHYLPQALPAATPFRWPFCSLNPTRKLQKLQRKPFDERVAVPASLPASTKFAATLSSATLHPAQSLPGLLKSVSVQVPMSLFFGTFAPPCLPIACSRKYRGGLMSC